MTATTKHFQSLRIGEYFADSDLASLDAMLAILRGSPGAEVAQSPRNESSSAEQGITTQR